MMYNDVESAEKYSEMNREMHREKYSEMYKEKYKKSQRHFVWQHHLPIIEPVHLWVLYQILSLSLPISAYLFGDP